MPPSHRTSPLIVAAALALLVSAAASASNAIEAPAELDALAATIAALDSAAFDAFNRCDQPGQLDVHAAYFDSGVEFYHDTGGVTWTRDAMLANTRQHVCGKFRRELVPGSLRVYPVKDFGAIELGTHRFCQFDTGQCDGIADFSIVWRKRDDRWQITRVLSYGHRAAAAGP